MAQEGRPVCAQILQHYVMCAKMEKKGCHSGPQERKPPHLKTLAIAIAESKVLCLTME